MAQLLFVDESGQDHHESPYEVLAGVSVEDGSLWNLIRAVQDAEVRIFGRRYSAPGTRELKAKKFLKRKVFRQAAMLPPFPAADRALHAKRCLDEGKSGDINSITALAQSKLAYVHELFDICGRFHCKVFASIIDPKSPVPGHDYLRKDYAYLFERFHYYLEAQPGHFGLVVFDELEKSQSHVLIGQMDNYFKRTKAGRQRAGLIIPEPFFVHSDLTTGIQLADFAAYVISWAVRFSAMDKPVREELGDFAAQLMPLRHRVSKEIDGNPDFAVWSLTYISDLRSKGSSEGPEIKKGNEALHAPKPPKE